MPNTYVNKVIKSNGETIIDLTQDTVTSSDHIMSGYTGHLASGAQVTGTGSGGIDGDNLAYGLSLVGSAIVGQSVVS